jgi:glycosyltransferase involved in cell wall biosynthesis
MQFAQAAERGLVSVIIPTYNRVSTVRRAIESALRQSYERLEVLVVDDGSSDDTRAVVTAFGGRVRYLGQPNAGVSAARNRGMRAAGGEFIAFLDSDDSWQPWKIGAQVAALRKHRDARITWTDMTAIDSAGQVIRDRYLRAMYTAYSRVSIDDTLPVVGELGAISADVPAQCRTAAVRAGDLSSAIVLGNLLHTSTVLFDRDCLAECGGFSDAFPRTGEDYEFYSRLTQTGRAVFIDAPSTLYRIGAEDQLGGPAMMLEISRNDLRTLRAALTHRRSPLSLPRRVVDRRLSDSLAWVGFNELEAGHNLLAARRLLQSLVIRPAVDRRILELVACGVPAVVRTHAASLARRVHPSQPVRSEQHVNV